MTLVHPVATPVRELLRFVMDLMVNLAQRSANSIALRWNCLNIDFIKIKNINKFKKKKKLNLFQVFFGDLFVSAPDKSRPRHPTPQSSPSHVLTMWLFAHTFNPEKSTSVISKTTFEVSVGHYLKTMLWLANYRLYWLWVSWFDSRARSQSYNSAGVGEPVGQSLLGFL